VIKQYLQSILILSILQSCSYRPPLFKQKESGATSIEKPFVIIVPSYNNQKWLNFNLNSIFLQKYKNYRVIYIDDCSTDDTALLVEKYIKKVKNKEIEFIKNKSRIGALANIYRAIQLCKENEIVVNLDGDDWFAHDQVLSKLNQIYKNPNIWITYGQFQNWPTGKKGWCKKIPKKIIKQNLFREYGFWFAQPRTYYAWLAQKVKRKDLINQQTSKFYTTAGDVALMFPMIEMSGNHTKFISDTLCYRNVKTPLNDFKCHLNEQLKITKHITEQQKYLSLEKI